MLLTLARSSMVCPSALVNESEVFLLEVKAPAEAVVVMVKTLPASITDPPFGVSVQAVLMLSLKSSSSFASSETAKSSSAAEARPPVNQWCELCLNVRLFSMGRFIGGTEFGLLYDWECPKSSARIGRRHSCLNSIVHVPQRISILNTHPLPLLILQKTSKNFRALLV